ncbi:F-box/FBD/LRR-repeat protein At2g04230-like [Aegilops tauschii subsp. strangulata]|uniref:F-box/FBD/LRR-repeat protein At2g04230-like n=1 Tax=Aegilops tauschii subsp. strangulata TaxID=200361 RepID=UPI003CC87C17
MHRHGCAAELASPVPSRSTGRTLEVGSGAPEEPRPRSRKPSLWAAYKRLVLLLAKVSTALRIPPPPPNKLNIDDPDEDRISALTDDILLGILERLDLRDAVRAGAVSTRWRHLPHRLSRLHLDVRHFGGATDPVATMEAFTAATCRLLSPPAECKRAIKTLRLVFFPESDPHLRSIGRAVEDVVTRGETECLEFYIHSTCAKEDGGVRTQSAKEFMSFSCACPVAFRWLTELILTQLVFGDTDVADIIRACDNLKNLTLRFCTLVEEHSTVKIDTPCSGLQGLVLFCFVCTRVELVSVPKLRQVWCESWRWGNPPVSFGYVPELRHVTFSSHAMTWQAPFSLSECLSSSAKNLSILNLNFCCQMIWIKPEHPKHLTAMLKNLTCVELPAIFPECDLNWTLFFLEAAPALQIFKLCRERYACLRTVEDSAEKTYVVWDPSKNLKHLNLKSLLMSGFEEEDKVTNYIRLVMERAVGLKRIEMYGVHPCEKCDATDPTRSQVNEACRRLVKERLTHGSSSTVEILIMC